PDSERAITVIDMHKPDQMYWYFGIAAALFAKLSEATGEGAFLDRASSVMALFERCRGNVAGDDLTVGKVAYASVVMYRLTDDARYLDICRQCSENLIRSQHADGYWSYQRRGDITEVNRSTMLDFCAELTVWCVEILKELSAAAPTTA
ncbi:hypothetical protein LCGC14_1785440, partial [marine sediment metagenome]